MRRVSLSLLSGTCLLLAYGPAIAEEQTEQIRTIDTIGLAESLNDTGNERAAVSILRQRTKTEDAEPEDFIKLAKTLETIGAHDEAVSALTRARTKFPGDTEVIFQLGRAYIAAGNPEQAVNVMDMLTAIEPNNAMAYNAKAVAFDRAGNHFAAQEIYDIALRVDPDSVPIQNNLAMSYILDDKLDRATRLLESLNEKTDGAQTKVRHNLALAYGLSGQKNKALAIGLEDLSEEEAKENLRFYEHYSSLKQRNKPVSLFSADDQMITEVSVPKEVMSAPAATATKLKEAPAPAPQPEATPPVIDEVTVVEEIRSDAPVQPEEAAKLAPAAGNEEQQDDTVFSGPTETKKKEEPFGPDAVYSYPKARNR